MVVVADEYLTRDKTALEEVFEKTLIGSYELAITYG